MEKTIHPILLYLFLSNLLCSKMASAQTIPIRVGVVLEMNNYGEMTFNCLSMALSDFYSSHQHYKTRLLLTSRHSKGDVVGAAAAALDLLRNVEVQAVIGPTFSMQASFLISLGDTAHVPVVSFSATSPSLSSIRSPYFVRATLSDASQVDAIGALVAAFGWREVVPVYEEDDFGEGIMPYLSDALVRANARIPYRSVVPPLASDVQIEAELYKLMTMQTRVFVVHMMSSLASRLFTVARRIGLMSPDSVWIVTNGVTNELGSLDPAVFESMLGVVGVRHYVPRSKELESFEARYRKQVVVGEELSIFGLWAYDAATALAIAAEKAGLRGLRYRNTTVSTNSTDLQGFGVSDEGPSLVKALSGTTFKGLAGNFRLVKGELEAPPLEIVNFVGDGVRSIGYWTKENGIVGDLSSRNDNSTSSKSKLASIIWPGEASASPRGWVVPTNGKKLRVGVPVKAGFTEFVSVTWNPNNSTRVEGYCIDVFDAVMAALPYGVPYEYIPFAHPNHTMAGNYNDLTYQVYLGKYDIVAGDVTIVANRSQYVDFTLPYTESGVAMIVPMRDDKSRNAWVFLKPLTWELWVTSFCSFVFIGFLIWILEHRINPDFRGPFWYQLGMIFWFAFSTMVFAHKERVVSNLSRLVLIIWFLMVLILTQSYTASLASMLTVQKLQPTVTDVNLLIRNKENVGYMQGSFVYGLLKGMNFEESRLVEYDSPEKLDELLSGGRIAAAFHEIPYIKLFLGKYCSKYTTISINKANGFGIVFPIGSPLVTDVSRAILNVTEGQKVAAIERKWLLQGDVKKCLESSKELAPHKNLGLASFWGLFLIVGVAGMTALMIYVVRFLRENWSECEGDDTVWRRIVEMLHKFDNKDMTSHTFKRDAYGGDCDGQSPSHFSLPSPRTDGPPSPVASSPGQWSPVVDRRR
ncbi:glutamate receptor 2.1-like [Salvia miltiorrhiza]|uniref:glutamate receptor 2.1-like n=1 Tax=Salvia miltiorrhiza TaxID=226208 RepID=UPI0025AB67DF|nr:glutamate receptor 2.1-like [Salvia miltiorrhiza]